MPADFPSTDLRLCYISNPNIIHTRRWVSWFVKRGYKVCVVADVPLKEAWPDIELIDLSTQFHVPILRFVVWTFWLKRFFRHWQPDIVHAHRVNSAGWLAAASGFHPYVVTPWGSDVFVGPQRSWLARMLARYTLQHADRITAISQAVCDQVLSLGGGQEQISRVHFGVDLDIFHPGVIPVEARNELLQHWSIPPGAPIVFSPRAVHPIYNLDVIMSAIPLVRQKYPQVCFLFTSYNPDPTYMQALDDLVRRLDLTASIRWMPATKNPAEMAERYGLADVVVSVPSSDGAPLTMLEAMACGKPVVCSDISALREFITDGENGRLVPVRDASALAQAIIQLLDHPEAAGVLGKKSLQLVALRADLEVEMRHMESIYHQLARR